MRSRYVIEIEETDPETKEIHYRPVALANNEENRDYHMKMMERIYEKPVRWRTIDRKEARRLRKDPALRLTELVNQL